MKDFILPLPGRSNRAYQIFLSRNCYNTSLARGYQGKGGQRLKPQILSGDTHDSIKTVKNELILAPIQNGKDDQKRVS